MVLESQVRFLEAALGSLGSNGAFWAIMDVVQYFGAGGAWQLELNAKSRMATLTKIEILKNSAAQSMATTRTCSCT